MNEFWRRILFFFRHKPFDRDLAEEMRQHVALKAEQLVESGVAPEEARYRAQREFGNEMLLEENSREVWQWRPLEELVQDLRYALRTMRRSPGFTAVAVASLALGIGANTAIFSLIDAVMLRMLPVKNPQQVVLLNWAAWKWPSGMTQSGHMNPDRSGRESSPSFSYPSFEAFRTHNEVFSNIFAFVPLGFDKANVNVNIDGEAGLVTGEMVSGGYFSGLGVSPVRGRALTDEDEKPGAPHVAVISYGYWERRFERNASAVGKTITVNSAPFTIVGVAPPEFFGVEPGRAPDIWVPVSDVVGPWGSPPDRTRFAARDDWWIQIMARLKPGVSEGQASAALDILFHQSIVPGLNPPPKREDMPHIELMHVSKGLDNVRRKFSKPLWILMSVVGLVLLIASANVAALLVARAAVRQKEMAVRLSIGAARARLIRQLITESVLVAAIGGAVGLFFAHWGTRALLLLIASGRQPVRLDVHPDPVVLGFTAAVSLVTGILFGLAPAFRATRVDLTPALRESAGSLRAGRSRFGLGKALVAAQVALSVPLVIGAGLLVRTLSNLENQSLGFERNNLLLFGVDGRQSGYEGPRLMHLYRDLLERIQGLPGVRSAGVSAMTLISDWKSEGPIAVAGKPPKAGEDAQCQWNTVGRGFFETMGIRLLAGRAIDWRDTESSPKVAVVNEAMARHFFGDRNPIGQRFHFAGRSNAEPEFEIVGVVQNAKYAVLRGDIPRTAYLAYNQMGGGRISFEVRAAGDPKALIPAVRRVVHDLEPRLPLADVKTQTQQIDEALFQERLFARLASFFGVLALLLAAIGLHGTMAYAVTRRTSEIGIRMALGAQGASVVWLVLREAMLVAAVGVIIGVPAALAASRTIASILFGVKQTDPVTLSVAALIMMAVAGFAGYQPARRASRIDPMEALRYE